MKTRIGIKMLINRTVLGLILVLPVTQDAYSQATGNITEVKSFGPYSASKSKSDSWTDTHKPTPDQCAAASLENGVTRPNKLVTDVMNALIADLNEQLAVDEEAYIKSKQAMGWMFLGKNPIGTQKTTSAPSNKKSGTSCQVCKNKNCYIVLNGRRGKAYNTDLKQEVGDKITYTGGPLQGTEEYNSKSTIQEKHPNHGTIKFTTDVSADGTISFTYGYEWLIPSSNGSAHPSGSGTTSPAPGGGGNNPSAGNGGMPN